MNNGIFVTIFCDKSITSELTKALIKKFIKSQDNELKVERKK
jgi:hypothetical protein